MDALDSLTVRRFRPLPVDGPKLGKRIECISLSLGNVFECTVPVFPGFPRFSPVFPSQLFPVCECIVPISNDFLVLVQGDSDTRSLSRPVWRKA